jgi:pimeloyl-ACP methyl ester carboxylesterase
MAMVRSCDGTSIAFRRYGTGPAIVLVGGAPGVAGQLAALLAASFTVFHHDRRGTGDSGDTAPYALAREVEDLEAVIATAGGPVSMTGLGSGTALALEAARTLPGITKLAICGPTPRLRPDAPNTPLTHLAAPGRIGIGFAAARWSCVSVPTLILDEHPTCSGADGSAFDGERLAGLLPDGRHRRVSRLDPAALAPHLAAFFTNVRRPAQVPGFPCLRA